jgi:transposase-like protein
MELVSKQQIRQYIKEGNLKDLNDVQTMIKDLFASTVQEMLEAEMDTHLGYTLSRTVTIGHSGILGTPR